MQKALTSSARWLIYAAVLLVDYMVAWVVAYLAMCWGRDDAPSIARCIEWFWMALRFEGLELVAFTWFLCAIIFVPLSLVSLYFIHRCFRS